MIKPDSRREEYKYDNELGGSLESMPQKPKICIDHLVKTVPEAIQATNGMQNIAKKLVNCLIQLKQENPTMTQ